MENSEKRKKRSAYSTIIRLLAKRDYSRYKMEQKLLEKDYPIDEIETALDEVIEKKFLREDYYIEARIKGYMHKYCTPIFIQQVLYKEHLSVPIDDIRAVFEEYEITTEAQIKKLISKKMPHSGSFSDYNAKQKLKAKIINFVCSKGHDLSEISPLLHQSLKESDF
jgi:regulatory protein